MKGTENKTTVGLVAGRLEACENSAAQDDGCVTSGPSGRDGQGATQAWIWITIMKIAVNLCQARLSTHHDERAQIAPGEVWAGRLCGGARTLRER